MMDWKKLYSEEFDDKDAIKALFHDLKFDEKFADILSSGGIISVPHTNVTLSGRMTAKLVYHLYAMKFRKIIALGIIHGRPSQDWNELKGGFMFSGNTVDTPFGDLPLASIGDMPEYHVRVRDEFITEEFSLDNIFALLKFFGRENGFADMPVLPIYLKLTYDPETKSYTEIARAVAQIVRLLRDKDTALICTGDLTHYGNGAGYCPVEYVAGDYCDRDVLRRTFLPKIEEIMDLALVKKDYGASAKMSNEIRNDQIQLLPVISELFSSAAYKIFELEFTDYKDVWQCPPPSYVASALVGYYRKKK